MADINITVDSSQIVRTRSELDSLGLTILKQIQTIQRLEKNYKQLDRAFNTGKLSAQQYAKGVKQLDAAIEEVSKDSIRAANATRTFSNAQSSAAIAAQNLTNAQRMSGKETNRFGMYAQQVGYQVGDFFIQIQSGTNALVAFGQQATQLAGLFPGLLGAALGIGISLGTAIGAAFMRMGEDAGSAAKGILTLADAQKQLNEASGDYALKLEMLRFGVDTQAEAVALKEIYDITAQIQNLIKQYEQTDSLGTRQRLAEEIQALKEQLSIQQDIVDEANKKRDAYEKALNIDKQMAAVQLGQAKAIGQAEKDRVAAGEAIYKGLLAVQSANQNIARSNNEVSQTIKNNYQVYAKTRNEAQALADATAKVNEQLFGSEKSAQGFNAAMEDALAAGVQFSLVDLNSIVAAAASNGWALAASIQAAWKAATQKAPADASVLIGGGGRPEIDLKNMEYRGAVMAAQAKILQKSFKDVEKAAGGAGSAIVETLTESEKAAKEFSDTMDGYVIGSIDGVANAFGDFITGGLKDFKGFVKDILGSFVNMLSQMIALAARNQIIIGLGLGAPAVAAGAASAGGAAMGSGFGASALGAGAATGIGGVLGTAWTGLSSGFMTSVYGGLGGTMGAVSGGLAVGGVSGFATAIGALAAPIAAVVAVISFFKKKITELDGGLKITANNAGTLVEEFKVIQTKKFWGLSKKTKTELQNAGSEISDPITVAVGQIQDSMLNMAKSIGLGADSFSSFAYNVSLSLKDMNAEQAQAAVEAELAKLGDAFANAALGWFEETQGILKDGETWSQGLERLANSLTTVNATMTYFDKTLFDISISGAKAASELVDFFGSLDNFNSAQSAYLQLFYTDQEKVNLAMSDMTRTFAALGVEVPSSNAAFRKLVEAQDLTQSSGRALYAALLQIAPAFDQVGKAAEQARQAQLALAQEVLQGAQTAYASAAAALKLAIDKEKAGIVKAAEAMADALKLRLQQAEEVFNKQSEVVDLLRNAASSRRINTLETQDMELKKANAYLKSLVGMGRINDVDTFSKALEAVQEPSMDLFTSFADYARSVGQTTGVIASLLESQEKILTDDELVIATLEKQIQDLQTWKDEQLAALDKQLLATEDTTVATLSVKEAIDALAQAIKDLAAAQTKVDNITSEQRLTSLGLSAGPSGGLLLVEKAYEEILGRAGDVAGVAFWNNVISSGQVPVANFLEEFRKGAVANQEVPRFAAGGFHSGGLRLVGEKGPELEITGPSRIYNSQRTKDLLSDSGNESLRSEIAQMRNELYAGLVQIAKNTAKTAVVLNKFDYDGLPDSRGY